MELSQFQILEMIKDACAEQPYIIGAFIYGSFTHGNFSSESNLDMFIIVSEKKYIDRLHNIMSEFSKNIKNEVKPVIWSFDEMNKPDNALVQVVFREGKLIYWNSLRDLVASQVFKVRPYTLFSFDLSNLEQKEKAKFNYKLYGKKDTGLLSEYRGKKVTKGCFYIPYHNKFKIIRFLDKFKIAYNCIECWL